MQPEHTTFSITDRVASAAKASVLHLIAGFWRVLVRQFPLASLPINVSQN